MTCPFASATSKFIMRVHYIYHELSGSSVYGSSVYGSSVYGSRWSRSIICSSLLLPVCVCVWRMGSQCETLDWMWDRRLARRCRHRLHHALGPLAFELVRRLVVRHVLDPLAKCGRNQPRKAAGTTPPGRMAYAVGLREPERIPELLFLLRHAAPALSLSLSPSPSLSILREHTFSHINVITSQKIFHIIPSSTTEHPQCSRISICDARARASATTPRVRAVAGAPAGPR